MRKWENLPNNLQLKEVKPYYDILAHKQFSLFCKRAFDIVFSFILLVVLSPLFLALAIAIKLDSSGPVFYRQTRITQYGKEFKIHKFRSMCDGADKKGTLVTVDGDSRVTRVGRFIRKCRLDEISQLIDVLQGNMSFVGTRPEVPKYVNEYTPEMMATLLLPAGITSEASINFKDEAELLDNALDNTDKVYVEQILPQKMKWNLYSLKNYGFLSEIGIMFKTVFAVLGLVKTKTLETDKEMISK